MSLLPAAAQYSKAHSSAIRYAIRSMRAATGLAATGSENEASSAETELEYTASRLAAVAHCHHFADGRPTHRPGRHRLDR
jgi:hypothetical protein